LVFFSTVVKGISSRSYVVVVAPSDQTHLLRKDFQLISDDDTRIVKRITPFVSLPFVCV